MTAPPDPVFVLRGCDSSITCLCCLDPEDAKPQLLSGTDTGKIYVWNLKTKRHEYVTEAHSGHPVLWIHPLTPSGDRILSHGRDGNIHQWTRDELELKKIGSVLESGVGFCACDTVTINGLPHLAMPSKDQHKIRLVSLDTHQVIAEVGPPSSSKEQHGAVMCLRIIHKLNNAPKLLGGYEDGTIALWDIHEPRLIDRQKYHKETVISIDFSDALKRGVSTSVDETLQVWTLETDGNLKVLTHVTLTNPGVNCVKIRDDSKIFATAGWDHRIRIFSAKSVKPLAVLTYHREAVRCVIFTSDHMLITGGDDKCICLWNVYR